MLLTDNEKARDEKNKKKEKKKQQTEIAKRLNAIIVQLLPFLAQEHQQQVANAVERAKQVTMSELNAIIGQQQQQGLQQLLQQIHAQQLPHGAVVGGLPPGGLLGFAGAAAAAAAAGVPPHLAPPAHPAAAAAAVQAQAQALLKPADLQQHRAAAETPEDRKPIALTDERLRQSVSPPEKFRTRTPDLESDPKRRKEEKLGHVMPCLGETKREASTQGSMRKLDNESLCVIARGMFLLAMFLNVSGGVGVGVGSSGSGGVGSSGSGGG
ncbi:protein groucho, partial [Vespula squamosa]